MEDVQVQQFKDQLLRLKSELQAVAETSDEATKTVELDQASVGRLSRIDAMQTQQMAQELARRRQQQLIKIESALRRIEAGDYGYCAVCDEEIDPRRLALDPANTRCVKCAEK